MALEDNIPRINEAIDSIRPDNLADAAGEAIEGLIPDVGDLMPDLGGFLPDVDLGGLMPDVGGCASDLLEGMIPDIGEISGLLSSNPLCNENLFKDIDGLASLGSLPSIPNMEQVISSLGVPPDIGKLLDPEVMFSGIPEFSGLIKLPSIPEPPSLEEVEAMAKSFADSVLSAVDIGNPLADLCNFKIPTIPEVPDFQGIAEGMFGNIGDFGLGDVPGALGVDIPDVGGLMPDIPGLDCITDSISLPDIDICDII